jgi:apolipoprotein N-acyltransferase
MWRQPEPIVLALISGGLYAFSNVGFGGWPLVFFFLIPLWIAIDSLSNQKNLKEAALLGFLFGLSAFAIGFPWLLTLTDKFLGSGILLGGFLWLCLGLWFALGFAVYALIYRCLSAANCPNIIAGAAPLVLLEWWQLSLFPSYSGAALIAKPILAQIADLGGPLLLSAFVVTLNSAIYAVYQWRLPKQGIKQDFPAKQTLSTVLLLASVLVYGHIQSSFILETKQGHPLKIGAIQSNLVMLDKDELSLRSHPVHLKQSKALLANHPVDLLIWPETAYVRGLRRPLPIDAQFIRSGIEAPLLFGGTSVWQNNGQKFKANSVFLADKEGKIEQVYDKSLLIPFAEYTPFAQLLSPYKEQLSMLFPQGQSFYSGGYTQAIQFGSTTISTPICYEIIHPDFIRQQVNRTRPQLIVTLANDAWFGDTQEPWIHLSMARLRAIEHRLWLVRSTNSGISAIVDPTGNITTRTGLHTQENLIGTVFPRTTFTLYAQYGNWVGWLALLLTLHGFYRLLISNKQLSPMTAPFFTKR